MEVMDRRQVMLLKAPTEDTDPYTEILETAGYTVTLVPVIQCVHTNSAELQSALQCVSSYSCLVVTSLRAVEACRSCTESTLKSWGQTKIYVVGRATEKAVQDVFHQSPIGAESGNALALSSLILADLGSDRRKALFLRGDLAKDTLVSELTAGGMEVDQVVVYQTRPNPDLEHILQNKKLPHWVVLFSPSGVSASLPLLVKIHGKEAIAGIRLVAIGPTTATEIEKQGWTVSAVAASPTPQAVLQAMESLVNSQGEL